MSDSVQKVDIPTMSVSELDQVYITSRIQISEVNALDIIQNHISEQNFWPDDLNTLFRVTCLYVPFWSIKGRGVGRWSASIGTHHVRSRVCRSCSGTGRVESLAKIGAQFITGGSGSTKTTCPKCGGGGVKEEKFTTWDQQEANVAVDVQQLEQNTVSSLDLECGEQHVDVANFIGSDELDNSTEIVIPKITDEKSGLSLAEDIIDKKLRSSAKNSALGDEVENFQMLYKQYENPQAILVLYPIYFGRYDYKDEDLNIQIDGVTGTIHMELPKSVRLKQGALTTLGIIALIAAVIFICIAIVESI